MKRYTAMFFSLFFLNCGGVQAAHPAPSEKSTSPPTQSTSRVSWVEVNDGNQFWRTINLNDKNVALIGNNYCPPCVVAKHWWETKIVPPGWQFVYWKLGPSEDPLTRSIKDIFRVLQERNTLLVPTLSFIESASDPKVDNEITAVFYDLSGCTDEADEFLRLHPQGTVLHF